MRAFVIFPVFLLLALAAFAVSPALAKKGKVTEIPQEDGSKIIIEMLPGGGSRAIRVGPDGKMPKLPEAPPQEAEPIEIMAPPPVPESAPAPEQPQAQPAVMKAPDAAPAPKEEPKAAPKPKTKKASAPPVRNVKPPKPAPPRELPPDTSVTEDLAVQIALDNAPASTGFKVRPVQGENGTKVFAVLFDTDSGPYEVLVDAVSGEVLSRQLLPANVAPLQPGYLARPPARPQ